MKGKLLVIRYFNHTAPFDYAVTELDSRIEERGLLVMEDQLTAYVMVGAQGSGKSTYAEKLARTENAVVISGDDIRAELYGSAEIQGNWVEIHDRIEELVAENCHRCVILDGTHYLREYRKEAIALLRSYGYATVEAIVMDASLANCIARNFQRRERNVSDYIVSEMHEKLQRSLKGIFEEDFTRMQFVY
jgi:predicted kinase